MGWLEDTLASLQSGGPAAFGPVASPFPDPPRAQPAPLEGPALWDQIEARTRADNGAADRRNAAGMARPAVGPYQPFPAPDQNAAAVQLAMGDAPAGTGVPVSGSPQFTPMGIPPSLQLASSISAPPPAAPAEPSPADTLPPRGQVPTPRPRPVAAPEGASDVSASRRPAQPDTPAAPVVPAEVPLAQRIANIGPGLMGIGAAMQGDMGHLATANAQREQALQLQAQQQNITAQALLRRGADPQEVAAAVKNPELLKAMIGKYFETKPAQNVGGMLVRERPDGKVDILLDNTKEESKKNPVVKDFTNPDGSVISKQWNPATSTWDLIPGFEKPSPKDKDRRLSVSDISKLSEEGGKLSQINTFQSTFKPEFGGWKSNKVGDLVNEAARNLPESVVGKNAAESAGWWQDYDRYKNMVRHELFGSALTKSESDAFMRADIGPGMTPEQITRNLATQKRVVEAAIRRKGKGLIGSTYDRGAIASAYGVQPEFFDQADDAPTTPSGGMIDIGGQKIKWSVK